MYLQNYFRKDYYKQLFKMHEYEDGPPGDEYYSGARGETDEARRRFRQDGPQQPASM